MLKVLPSHISNLIAAGEVVQRPSSVVKELMENGVDAGASEITVIINDSGRTLIQVIDNGCGMTKEEAALSFERHATSKIEKAEDLYSIGTYGFRGEALASIAACAEVTLKTKKKDADYGTVVEIAESAIKSLDEASCAEGSNFSVRNIFYNIPARRKFLKSDNVEYRQIVQEFTRVALTRLDVEFRLIHNSKDIFHLVPAQNLKQRIIHICGKDTAKDLVDVGTDTSVVSIRGFVGRPELAKKSQSNQYLFVNGRFFKSPALHKAIIKGYNNLIPDGYTPSYFIYLEIEPQNLDVNIHPAKTEIKFENESVIFEILLAAVREAIGGNSFMPGIDFDTEGVPDIPAINTGFDKKVFAPPQIDYDPLFNPFEQESKTVPSKWNSSKEWNVDNNQDNTWEKNYSQPKQYKSDNFFNEDDFIGKSIIQLKGRYIITPVKSGLMLIDIYRAKERILYESYLNAITSGNPGIQENLYPQTIDLDHNSYSIIMENAELAKQLGFDIRSFGKDCIVVYGTPAINGAENISVTDYIDNLIADLQEEGKDLVAELKEKAALNMIKSGRINEAQTLNTAQANELIDILFSCNNPYTSPLGEKCVTIITMDELIKKL